MIIGIGSDLVDIRRIEKILARFGDRFLQRVFAPEEIEYATRRAGKGQNSFAATLAKRYAAKEAAAKALGTGFRNGLRQRHFVVENDANGRPALLCVAVAEQLLMAQLPEHHSPRLHLSLSDDYPLAQAFVIVEAVAEAAPH